MARIPSLVWAVPMTLALLVLAKGALQRIGSPAPPHRVAPVLVERLEPPGRLHAPDDARPVTAAPPAPTRTTATNTATNQPGWPRFCA